MSHAIQWRIALFAGLAERLRMRELALEYEETELPIREIKRRLASLHPEAAELIGASFMARNQEFAADDVIVSNRDELALLPPVSGGSGHAADSVSPGTAGRYAVVADPLDAQRVSALVAHPDHGAILVFIGTTREWTNGKRTATLEYEAYEPMAVASLREIGEEIGRRWPGSLCAIHHRIGTVGIGEASVVIAVSSPHRHAGYEASRYAIERLKKSVPIWKKEVYEDGSEWVGQPDGTWDPLSSL